MQLTLTLTETFDSLDAIEAFATRLKAAFDFGFDVRREVVDHVLHDQLRGGAQFVV